MDQANSTFSDPLLKANSASPAQTDTSLIRLLQQSRSDDPQRWQVCLEQFYQQYMPVIYGWCRQRGLSQHDALDVGHDLMVDIGRKLKRYSSAHPGRFSDWLYTVTRNAVFDFYNRQRRRRSASLEADDFEAGGEDLLQRLVAAFELEIRRAALARVERETDELNRQILDLCFRQGVPGAEAAGRLGIQPAALYQRVRRIRVELARVQADMESRGAFFMSPVDDAAADNEASP
jgi:RNA polymerase sigma factor (sigma-70 family)